ncbi:contractile injection system tape measure protein [Xenorhabdus khoisanae]|uniref:contractile injection system tape measure protein n=1 Tax=Xenorhabdus khoisanae TaxID=880157 RepID=UPI0032B711D4
MSLSESVSERIVYKTVFVIETSGYNGEKIMDRCSFVFNKKLKEIITENIISISLNNKEKLSLEKVIVDLGNIDLDFIETEMPKKLATGLRKALSQYYHSSEYIPWTERVSYPQSIWKEAYPHIDNIKGEKKLLEDIFNQQSAIVTTRNAFAGTQLIEKVDYYLRKGYWSSEDRTNTVYIDSYLWQQINHQPQQWLPMLAKHCLQPAGLSRLIKICQPDVLCILCQLFTEKTTSEFINSQAQANIDIKVTPEKLSLAAEYYLQRQMKYTHSTRKAFTLQTKNKLIPERHIVENSFNSLKQDNNKTHTLIGKSLQTEIKKTSTVNITQNECNQLKQTHNETDIQIDAIPPFAPQPMQTSHQPAATQQHYSLIKETVKQSTATLQNREQHRKSLKSALSAQIPSTQPSNRIQTPSAQSVLSISNAGCMILWPLLPTFFRIFDLLDKNRFISLEAQREAVCLLDWLIWAEEEIPAWRLTLNKVLCGLPIHDKALWRTPKPEQQIAINQWLEKIIEQLPAWKKMGVNDVRHLFLQRSGELSELNGITNIHIKPEVYDALISEWPWPMNIANFSWLQHPITITWS